MIECPDYGDPTLVPAGWYERLECRQIVYGSTNYGFGNGEYRPVCLRGSKHSRRAKYQSDRDYGLAVIHRYVRMLRVTELNETTWKQFCREVIFPMAERQSWWFKQRTLVDLVYRMVDGENFVLIDGKVRWPSEEMLKNVKRIDSMMKKAFK